MPRVISNDDGKDRKIL